MEKEALLRADQGPYVNILVDNSLVYTVHSSNLNDTDARYIILHMTDFRKVKLVCIKNKSPQQDFNFQSDKRFAKSNVAVLCEIDSFVRHVL